MKTLFIYRWCLVGVLFLSLGSCRKFTEIPPPTNAISSENVFITDQTAAAVLNGLYTDLGNGSFFGTGAFTGKSGFSLILGLSADELTYYPTGFSPLFYYRNNLSARSAGFEYWPLLYNRILRCNLAIEGLSDPIANALTPAIRKQLLAEARFMRAFYYFYLVNLYGELPLALTTDYKVNSVLSRSPVSAVYQQIIGDLTAARDALAPDYLDASILKPTAERVRPTQWAARALLARAYLYTADYVNAETEASAIINQSNLYSLPALNAAFLKNSRETIWQVQPTSVRYNTDDARVFIIPATGPTSGISDNPVSISPWLLGSFEVGDQRAVIGNWIGSVTAGGITYYFPYKYKANFDANITASTGASAMKEYLMVFRLGEQYLIRAEARIRQGSKIADGISDLNALRLRATDTSLPVGNPGRLPALSLTLSAADAIKAVNHERQVELFTEYGQRWFDLKRTGDIHAVMSIVTPLKSNGTVEWQDYQQLFPLPTDELTKAPNLKQNPGY